MRSPFGTQLKPGRFGSRFHGPSPVRLKECPDLALRVISAASGKGGEIAAAVASAVGLDLPEGAKRMSKDGLALIGTAPGQWLAVAEGDAARKRLGKLVGALQGLATVVDLTDGKAVLRVSGPRARDTLAKGCSLDLHPRAFKPGDAATTPVALIDCQIWQLDETPTYALAVPSSLAESFWDWLTASAAEFGYTVE
jgi:sarcosine oxidase subunit gamma